jgi:hypothetical protein
MTATASRIYSGTSTPRYATPRTENRTSLGAEVAAIAQLLGQPLLPWQRAVADVALELLPDGRPAYRTVVVVVPRQAGKTTLTLSVALHRALRWGTPQNVVYTAQSGHHARKKFRNDQLPIVEASRIRSAVDRIYLASGLEALVFKNGSRMEPLPSTASAMHGKTIDLAILDEARFDKDNSREAGALPAMATRRDAQLWIISAAGDVESTFLRDKVEKGRAAVEQGVTSGLCYVEYSAPEDADIDDPATWQHHPGLGYLITADTIAHARQTTKSPDEFAQEWLGIWSKSVETVIHPATWQKVTDRKAAPDGPLAFCVDIALDRSRASIAVADRAGRIEIVETRDGMAWVAERIRQLSRRHKAPFVVDGYGPAGTLVEPLEALGIAITRYTTRDVIAACGLFYDAIQAATVKVRPNESLDAAVAAVRKRSMPSGWLWARTDVDVDITPLYAATLAWHNATQKKPEPTKRSFAF